MINRRLRPSHTGADTSHEVRPLLAAAVLETTATIDSSGIPIIGARLEFGDQVEFESVSRHDEALRLLNRILDRWDITVWIVLDRLDEAFQGMPNLETPALKALLRTYLDSLAFPRLRLKLFVRRDLFVRLTAGGFVNLTHVNARKIEIAWDDEDLDSLLHKRFVQDGDFIRLLGLPEDSADEVFYAMFPRKVDPGSRRPTTWTWMLGRIRDGNGVKPPRNLIDLVLKAREAQLRRESRGGRTYAYGQPLIEADSLKRGLEALSSERVEDTLLAEAAAYAPVIERFRGGKAEHNNGSLRDLLGGDYEGQVKVLRTLGFLEQVGNAHKVPMLYRAGLGITQGKAYAGGGDDDPNDD